MKFALVAIALVAVLASQLVAGACHNATGSCTKEHFVCANEELVPHAKRCNGVEDCGDGTDEYMCDQAGHRAVTDMKAAERDAIIEASCVYCTCYKTYIYVTSPGVWFNAGLASPRSQTMMTDAPNYLNRACNPLKVTKIKLNVYKKNNKGCRGWVCCLRQEECTTCTAPGNTATHCY